MLGSHIQHKGQDGTDPKQSSQAHHTEPEDHSLYDWLTQVSYISTFIIG